MRHMLLSVASVAAAVPFVAQAADLDAVAAAPANHKILLENDAVRVLQVEVAPGDVEAIHSHRWPSVMHIQSPQPLLDIMYRSESGTLIEVGRQEVPLGRPPAMIWVPPEAPHAIRNLATGPFRAIRVELKQAPADQE